MIKMSSIERNEVPLIMIDDACMLLASRSYAYQLLQSVFGNEPSADQLGILASETTAEALKTLFAAADAAFDPAVHSPRQTLANLSEKADVTVQSLRSEYTRLLIGPHSLSAPPWASQYPSGDSPLFGSDALKVRSAYRSQGFLPAEYPHVADDHIALELDFMHKLASRMENACDSDDLEMYDKAREASSTFLETYLLDWITEYARRLMAAEPGFYSAMAGMLCDYLLVDKSLLERLTR